jgi:hypothetical protein
VTHAKFLTDIQVRFNIEPTAPGDKFMGVVLLDMSNHEIESEDFVVAKDPADPECQPELYRAPLAPLTHGYGWRIDSVHTLP